MSRLPDAARNIVDEVAAKNGRVPAAEKVAAHKGVGIEHKGIILPFRTAKEIAESTPREVPWICYPWVAQGSIVEIAGKIKAAGKTTWVAAMVGKVLDGEEFMGGRTARTPVLILTEQQPTSFRQVLKRAGLLDREDLHILYWHEVAGIPWNVLMPQVVEYAKSIKAKMLVVDTLMHWARVKDENSTSEALTALAPLQLASGKNMAVVVIRHERKSGGDIADAGRGSSAFGGAVDHLISLRRPPGNNRGTVREIESMGRFEEAPEKLMIELDEKTGEYKALGTGAAFAVKEAMPVIVEKVPATSNNAITEAELVDRVLAHLGGKGSRSSIKRALGKLIEAGTVKQAGRGVKGDPRTYYKPLTGVGVF